MEENNNQKLDFIDALRGIAIFGVIAVHCTCTGLPSYIRLITEQGARGVQLFFLVSALTLFFSLSKREHKEKHLNINFFIRRFFRIAPMYYISLLIYLGLYWLEGTSHISKANILSHFLFLNGFNPYHINSILSVEWSVAVEMTFYVLVPILFKCIKTTTSSITAAFITLNIYVIISIVTNHIIPIKNKELWMSYKGIWFVSQAPVFMLGIILYFILFKQGKLKTKTVTSKNEKFISILLLSISLYIMLAITYGEYNNVLLPLSFLFGLSFMIFTISISIYPLRIFVNRFWCLMGKVSFSMYLLHLLVLEKISSKIVPTINSPIIYYIVLLITTTIITMAISYITYKIIEQPFQKLGKNIITKIEKVKY